MMASGYQQGIPFGSQGYVPLSSSQQMMPPPGGQQFMPTQGRVVQTGGPATQPAGVAIRPGGPMTQPGFSGQRGGNAAMRPNSAPADLANEGLMNGCVMYDDGTYAFRA